MDFVKKVCAFFGIFFVLLSLMPSLALADSKITVEARAAMLVDVNTGEVLMEQNADARMYPASLTKIMTALIVDEHADYADIVTASASALSSLPSSGSSVNLREGEMMSVQDLMYAMLLPSGNDAASVLAEYVGGTTEKFVAMMNEKAAELGCTGTHFANPHGLHDAQHYTTARDMYLIAREFVKNDRLMNIANTVSYVIQPTNKTKGQRILNSTNYLISSNKTIKYIYSYARGIKTGTTTEAGYCLVSSAEKNGLYLVSVVLGAGMDESSNDIMSFVETKRLFEWGFNNYSYQSLVSSGDPIVEVPVSMSQEADSVVAVTQGEITHLMPSGFNKDDVVITPWLDSTSLTAPVVKGQVLGEADVSYGGKSYGRVKLVALTSVERSDFAYSLSKVTGWLERPAVLYAVIGVVAAALLYIVFAVIHNRRKHRKQIKKGGYYNLK